MPEAPVPGPVLWYTLYRKQTLAWFTEKLPGLRVWFTTQHDWQEWQYLARAAALPWADRLLLWPDQPSSDRQPDMLLLPRLPAIERLTELPSGVPVVILCSPEEWEKLDRSTQQRWHSLSTKPQAAKKNRISLYNLLSKTPKLGYTEQLLMNLLRNASWKPGDLHSLVTGRHKTLAVYPGFGTLKGTAYPAFLEAICRLLNQGDIQWHFHTLTSCLSRDNSI